MLTPHGWIAVSVTVAVFLALQLRRRAPMDLLFLGGLVVVTASGVLTPQEAVAGFARAFLPLQDARNGHPSASSA